MAQTFNPEVIKAAIEGFESQKVRIDQQLAELRNMLDGNGQKAVAPSDGRRGKRKFSPDALRRMREAQQRRWARARGESETHTPDKSAAPTKKHKMSAAGRAAIVAALKKRWAAKKGTTTQPGLKAVAQNRKQPIKRAKNAPVKRSSPKERTAAPSTSAPESGQ